MQAKGLYITAVRLLLSLPAILRISRADFHDHFHHDVNAAHFHMQDQSPAIELHATLDGVHIKTRPATLDVASKIPQSHRHLKGYGLSGYGSNGYGSNGYASNGGASKIYGSNGYGSNRYESNGYGSNRYESNGYGSNRYESNGGGSNRYDSNRYGSNGYGSDGGASNGYGSNRYESNGGGSNGYGSNGYGSNGYGSNGYESNRGASNGYGSNEDGSNEDGSRYGNNGWSSNQYGSRNRNGGGNDRRPGDGRRKGRWGYNRNRERSDDEEVGYGNGAAEHEKEPSDEKEGDHKGAGGRVVSTNGDKDQHKVNKDDLHGTPPIRNHPDEPINYDGSMINSLVRFGSGYKLDLKGYKKHGLRPILRRYSHRRLHRRHHRRFRLNDESREGQNIRNLRLPFIRFPPYAVHDDENGPPMPTQNIPSSPMQIAGTNMPLSEKDAPASAIHDDTAGPSMLPQRMAGPGMAFPGMATSMMQSQEMTLPGMNELALPGQGSAGLDATAQGIPAPFTNEPFPREESQLDPDRVSVTPFLPRDYANQMSSLGGLMQGFYQSSALQESLPLSQNDQTPFASLQQKADYENLPVTGNTRQLQDARSEKDPPLPKAMSSSFGANFYQTVLPFRSADNVNDKIEKFLMGFPFKDSSPSPFHKLGRLSYGSRRRDGNEDDADELGDWNDDERLERNGEANDEDDGDADEGDSSDDNYDDDDDDDGDDK